VFFLKKGVPIYVGSTHLQRLTDECIKLLIEVLFDKVLLLLIILCIIYTVIEDAIASLPIIKSFSTKKHTIR
jgi:hypothetical protein